MTKYALTMNFGLVGSTRFPDTARSRVLPENPTAIHGLNVPYIVVGIIADLEELGFTVHCTRIADSHSEPTLVCQLSAELGLRDIRAKLHHISTRYAQDCVAVRFHDEVGGELIGMYKHIWGDFNPHFFMEYDA